MVLIYSNFIFPIEFGATSTKKCILLGVNGLTQNFIY